MNSTLMGMGNSLFKHAPLIYRPLYSVYKAISDRPELRILREHILPGMTVVDIGANIGEYSRRFSGMVGAEGRVIAFEPEQRNFELLQDLAKSKTNVEAFNSAIGSSVGQLKLYLSDSLNVDHHTYDDGEGRDFRMIPVLTLDEFFSSRPPPDFIKMDIQGYEYEALKGAKEIMSSSQAPMLLFEYWPFGLERAGCNPSDLIGMVCDFGYRVNIVGKDCQKNIADVIVDPDVYVNVFATKHG
ncbi:MAG: hypothetical protein AUJ58_09025 [Zetaproteobacteria bacterium CG1_02_55_237]|nr:MAG: hypothetical protein AUJ58_09025 [Zetaproteobacteria bacterium CG1_02_55_237]